MYTTLKRSKRGHKTEAAATRTMEREFFANREADTGDVWYDEPTGRWHWHITTSR